MEFEPPVFRMIEIKIEVSTSDAKVFYEFDENLDIEYLMRKLHGALKVPKEFLKNG